MTLCIEVKISKNNAKNNRYLLIYFAYGPKMICFTSILGPLIKLQNIDRKPSFYFLTINEVLICVKTDKNKFLIVPKCYNLCMFWDHKGDSRWKLTM